MSHEDNHSRTGRTGHRRAAGGRFQAGGGSRRRHRQPEGMPGKPLRRLSGPAGRRARFRRCRCALRCSGRPCRTCHGCRPAARHRPRSPAGVGQTRSLRRLPGAFPRHDNHRPHRILGQDEHQGPPGPGAGGRGPHGVTDRLVQQRDRGAPHGLCRGEGHRIPRLRDGGTW